MTPHWKKRPELMQEMRRLGVLTDVTEAELIDSRPSKKVRIDAVGGDLETRVFDLDPVGTGYMAWISLTVVEVPFAIAGFSLTLPWKVAWITWLSDPADGEVTYYAYRFPGRRAEEFPRDSVVNHRADVQKMLRRGQRVEGFLLGYSSDPIPNTYKHGQHILGNIGVFDQFDESYSAEANFWIDRSAKISSNKLKRPLRESLFVRHAVDRNS